jgi:uncharacterized membrane protein YczE
LGFKGRFFDKVIVLVDVLLLGVFTDLEEPVLAMVLVEALLERIIFLYISCLDKN